MKACAAVAGALRHHNSVCQAGHDAVSPQEVQLVRVGVRKVFCKKSAVFEHAVGGVLVARRV